jgi:DNA-binding response OmpR family regulator
MPAHILLAAREAEREIIHSILQCDRYRITVASSIESALSALESEDYQVALIDEDFVAAGEGWTLARTIRQQFSAGFVILMLVRGSHSQYAGSERGEFLYKVNWIMPYPVSEEEILHNIERYLKVT